MSRFVKEVVTSAGGVVVAQSRRAAGAGAEVLRAGGNAVDAAVATSLALGVCEPWMSGIGGGCAALIQPPGAAPVALDGGMVAPLLLDPAAYPLAGGTGAGFFAWPAVEGERNVTGPLAVAVPGLVAGLGAAHARFGRLAWAEVLAPAIAIADAGHAVDWYTSLLITSSAAELRAQPAAAAHYLPDGLPPSPDWRKGRITLDTTPLARSYRRLADAGAADFYRGDLAAAWLHEAEAAGTWLRRADLERYAARWTEPLGFAYRDATVTAMDGLFAGVTLKGSLDRLAERWPGGPADAQAYAAYASSLKEADGERLATLGHAAQPGNTTHFCVVDGDGMVVSWTQTLLSLFGAHVLLPRTGILLNNGIMWFDPEPGKPNSLGAGKRCLMNVCPVIGEQGEKRFAFGASGGRKIVSAVAQLASFATDFGMDVGQAFHQPRIDVSGGETVVADSKVPAEAIEALGAVHPVTVTHRTVYPYAFACPAGVMRQGDTNSGCTEIMNPWGDAAREEDVA